MASSSDVYNQIQALLGQVNPMLEKLPEATKYYKDETNKAYDYNRGPLQNAADLEKKMYSMPGELMNQYDSEFGGKLGIDSNQRINSILSQLGNQTGVVNVASGLATQAGTRIDDMAKTLLDQYKSAIDAKQMELSPLMSIWDRLFSEEQANSRARMSGGNGGYVNPWGNINFTDEDKKETPAVVNTSPNVSGVPTAGIVNSLKGGTFRQDYMGQPKPTVPVKNPFDINPLRAI